MGNRAIVIVMDGCGAGAAPDHDQFGDGPEVSTIRNVWNHVGGFRVPILESLGFLAATGITPNGSGRYGRLQELSQGKDSVTGHWEMMGVITPQPFPTFPDGFPIALIKQFEGRIGTQTIGNRAASGTDIIAQLGELHMDTGFPIVYTSADSVFQIACHEDVVPVTRLYEMCEVARELSNVQRVIARPFVGQAGAFRRTDHRKDFPVPAPPNLVDHVGDVFGIGVVSELFGGRGFRNVARTQSNEGHAVMMEEAMSSDARFIFANFEDFDMLYGHRNDPNGFAKSIERFDVLLGSILARLAAPDVLLITADHGNDPTSPSTDHSREFVPILVANQGSPGYLGEIAGFSAIGATVAHHLGIPWSVGQVLF